MKMNNKTIRLQRTDLKRKSGNFVLQIIIHLEGEQNYQNI